MSQVLYNCSFRENDSTIHGAWIHLGLLRDRNWQHHQTHSGQRARIQLFNSWADLWDRQTAKCETCQWLYRLCSVHELILQNSSLVSLQDQRQTLSLQMSSDSSRLPKCVQHAQHRSIPSWVSWWQKWPWWILHRLCQTRQRIQRQIVVHKKMVHYDRESHRRTHNRRDSQNPNLCLCL